MKRNKPVIQTKEDMAHLHATTNLDLPWAERFPSGWRSWRDALGITQHETELAWPQENRVKGGDPGDDCRNADEPRDDCGSRKKLFRSDDKRDDNHHERIHDSEGELNRHRRGAAGTTGRALLATKPKTGFLFEA